MNVLKPDKKTTKITLSNSGLSQREIFRKTKIDRKTIRKYALQSDQTAQAELNSKSPTLANGSETKISANNLPLSSVQNESKVPSHARSACEPHRKWIEEQVRLGRNGVSIYQDLIERYGFGHKYNSVKRFVGGLKKQDPKQFDRLEFPPGEEAQVDYGIGAKTLHHTGKYRKPRLFVMTLKYSGRSFRKVVWKSSQETWATGKICDRYSVYGAISTDYTVFGDVRDLGIQSWKYLTGEKTDVVVVTLSASGVILSAVPIPFKTIYLKGFNKWNPIVILGLSKSHFVIHTLKILKKYKLIGIS